MRKDLDEEVKGKVIEWGHLQCGLHEVAYLLGVDPSELRNNKRFNEVYYKALAEGKLDIRKMQFNAAQSGNAMMCKWLGQQYLGQRETVEQVIDTKTMENIGGIFDQLKGIKVEGVDG
jgi:hypothetical protein